MTDTKRPDWLPEDWTYRSPHYTRGKCVECFQPAESHHHAQLFADKHRINRVKSVRWCDSPDCEARARKEIMGE